MQCFSPVRVGRAAPSAPYRRPALFITAQNRASISAPPCAGRDPRRAGSLSSVHRSTSSKQAFLPSGPLKGHVYTRRRVAVSTGSGVTEPLVPLGLDFLTFLAATVLVIPLFKSFKLSPVLGFLFSGVVLQQLGLFQDQHDLEKLSELGVLFLLFEMGLELSLDRLKALAKYAFGLGSLQVIVSTAIFSACALPVGRGLATLFLENVANAPPNLVSIRSVDEAIVIGAALSMSSSAFVLQLLSERGELATRYGSATLGVLLFQDIAVVPFLVLLPLITGGDAKQVVDELATSPMSLLSMLGPTALQTVLGLGGIWLADKLILKRIFQMVASSRNSETFIALCLLTVAGTSLATQRMGLSDTLGAFLAGVLLSETSYRTQVEADIRPFKGLLLGLFFVTTGSTIDMDVFQAHWQETLWILAGLLVVKTAVVSVAGPLVGLSRNESIRTGFMLSQGGEFAFVLLSLANQLRILPSNLNQLLIIVVVLSMALTPGLAEAGKVVADKLDEMYPPRGKGSGEEGSPVRTVDELVEDPHSLDNPVVICGFTPAGQMVANLLESPIAGGPIMNYIAFDSDVERVRVSQKAGFRVLYGDGTRAVVLRAAGVEDPQAVVVCYADKEQALQAVYSCRADFPEVPIYACAADLRHAAELEEAGANNVVIRSVEAGLALGSQLLGSLGASQSDVGFRRQGIQDSIDAKTQQMARWLGANGEVPAFASLDMVVVTDSASATAPSSLQYSSGTSNSPLPASSSSSSTTTSTSSTTAPATATTASSNNSPTTGSRDEDDENDDTVYMNSAKQKQLQPASTAPTPEAEQVIR